MSDAYFDALRDAGEYPRKGYGWQDDDMKRQEIEERLASGDHRPWVLREAARLKVPTRSVAEILEENRQLRAGRSNAGADR